MRSSHSFALATAIFSILLPANAYTLVETYDHTNFFDEFNFFQGADPTHGFVDYVQRDKAQSGKLIHYENNQVYLGVDHDTYNPAGGRASVRLTSNQAFTKGLFIADIAHMPSSTCGSWPAFWMFGPNWPSSGEIDIIEGVNKQSTNSITLHTGPGCSVHNPNSQKGTTTITTDCNKDNGGTGCSVSTSNPSNYGTGFNNVGGGVYAMQWASSGIYVWFWQRSQIPEDVIQGHPNVQSWGTPLATFESGNGGCSIDNSFMNHNIVFDTTFCGSWAGSVWGNGECASLAPSCQQYVAENPEQFGDAFWLINSVKVYQ